MRGAARALVVCAASVVLLSGCAAADDVLDAGGDAAVSGVADEPAADVDVPDECRDAFPLATGPADISEIELQPADWPSPPDGATLCMTAEAIGGSTETASYATDAHIDDVLSHYEAALAGSPLERATGDENGTGYATLTGGDGSFGFQIREREGGFVLAFGRDDSGG